MISSYIRGRIRLKAPLFQREDFPLEPILAYPGIKSVSHNPRVGSLLVEYDPEALDLDKAASFLEMIDPEAAQTLREYSLREKEASTAPSGSPKERRPTAGGGHRARSAKSTVEFLNLTLAFGACLVSGLAGARKFHTQCGLLLAGMVAQHAWRFRRRLKPLNQLALSDFFELSWLKKHKAALEAAEELEEDLEEEPFEEAGPGQDRPDLDQDGQDEQDDGPAFGTRSAYPEDFDAE
jgi:hypothetical protein